MDDLKTRRCGPMTRRSFVAASGAALTGLPFAGICGATAGTSSAVRFGIFTDPHYADREPAGTRHYRDSLNKLQACVEQMNELSADFLVDLGDFKDQDETPVESRTLAHLQHIEEVFCEFRGPRFHVLGNHDMDSLSKAQFLSQVQNSGIPASRSFYPIDIKGLHGVVLDANHRSDGSDYDHGDFDWTDSNIPQTQLDWLKQDLAGAQPPCVVFVHQRLDGKGDLFVKNAEEVRTALEQSRKVLAVFQGHHHEGGYSLINGLHYYTLKAMVEGPGLENNAYAVVDLDGTGKITITGYGKAVSRGTGG